MLAQLANSVTAVVFSTAIVKSVESISEFSMKNWVVI